MTRSAVLLVSLLLALAPRTAPAHTPTHGAAAQATAGAQTVTGEVVDTGCFLEHGARGPKHVSCANKCIAGGMPMGLLAADGTLYLLTLNHDNADPYQKLKTMAGRTVSVTGAVMSRGGMKGIDVASVKPVAMAAAK